MLLLLAVLLAFHGLIHFMGVAKAFRLADLPELTQPISPAAGLLWLLAALLFLATAGAIFFWPRGWWLLGAAGIVVSMAAIVPSWTDARWGTAANALVAVAVLCGFSWYGPSSLLAEYDRDVAGALADDVDEDLVTEADLAPLPDLVRRYVRLTGAVGRPRASHVRIRMHGRIRGAPEETWMPFSSEQHNFFAPPARLFYMTARRSILPVQGYHRYIGASATMRIRIAGLMPVSDLGGDELAKTETVTLFNDMCLMAPATLIDPSIAWSPVDNATVRATFTNAGHTIHAFLAFAADGRLINFWSDDRRRTAEDGRTLLPARWSTPIDDYRSFAGGWLPAIGAARWSGAFGDFAYLEFEIEQIGPDAMPTR